MSSNQRRRGLLKYIIESLPAFTVAATNEQQMSNRRKVKVRDRSNADLEGVVLRCASAHPEFGQARVARDLKKSGYFISASGVRYIWKRHDLETTYKRLKAIEKSSKRGAVDFTADQQAVLERGDSSLKLARKWRARRLPAICAPRARVPPANRSTASRRIAPCRAHSQASFE